MKSKKMLLKKSCLYSYAFITGISTITGILGYTVKDIFKDAVWWKCSLILICLFLIISLIIFGLLVFLNRKGFSTIINGKDVCVKNGNIFNIDGLKVIPFNERFDTKVDDIVISHDSLNGQMIDKNSDKLKELNKIIRDAKNDSSSLVPVKKGEYLVYPLGRIIKFNDYLMLSMSHFDEQNRAYINIHEYEIMLSNMWDEIRRVYAGKKIVMPLIGSGITTITGSKEKDNTVLLKCMLCTLRRSKFQPKNGIVIVLTQDTIDKIDLVRIKEKFKNGI